MANTHREIIASNHSNGGGDNHLSPELLSCQRAHPVTFTPELQIRQAADSSESLIGNRLFSAIGRAVDLALDLHRKTGRSTTSIVHGNLVGKPLFAVSIMRWHAVDLHNFPTRDQLFAFALPNSHLLLKPEYALGTWFDNARGVHVIDIVLCVDTSLLRSHSADISINGQFSISDVPRRLLVSSTLEKSATRLIGDGE